MKTKKNLTKVKVAKVIHSRLLAKSNCYEISNIVRARYIICDESEISMQIALELSEAIDLAYCIRPKIIKIMGDVLSVGVYGPRKASFLPVILSKTIEEIKNRGQKIIIANRFVVDKLQGDKNCHFCNIDDFRTDGFFDVNKPKEASWGQFSVKKTANIILLRPDIDSLLAAVYLYHETGGTAKIIYLKPNSEFNFSDNYSSYMSVLNFCTSLGVKNFTTVPIDHWKDASFGWSSNIFVVPQSLSLPFSYYKSSENRKFYVVKQDFDTMMRTNRRNFLADIDELAILGDNLFRQGKLANERLREAFNSWFSLYKARLFKEQPISDGLWRMLKHHRLNEEMDAIIAKHKPIIEKKYHSQ